MGKFLPYHLPIILLVGVMVFSSIVALPALIFHNVIDMSVVFPDFFHEQKLLCLSTIVGKAKMTQIIVMFIVQFALPFPIIVVFTILMILQVIFLYRNFIIEGLFNIKTIIQRNTNSLPV